MGCTYCYESSVGFLTSILVFDWLVDNFKAAAIGLLHFCGIGVFSAGSSGSDLFAFSLRRLRTFFGPLWTFFGSTGPLRASSFGPCFLPLAFLRPLCLLAFSFLDLFF